ncbi:MAG: hypothetical protein IIA88_09290, partial [Bacteroidetes bacterium]|nr:hypothetical protein [Bacteroidota bacterium]
AFNGIIQVRFRGLTGPGFRSDMAIDDIKIYDIPANDVSVIAIDTPITGCGLTAIETVTISVKNVGLVAQSTIPVS